MPGLVWSFDGKASSGTAHDEHPTLDAPICVKEPALDRCRPEFDHLGENDQVLASGDEMIDAVALRSGMWAGRPKYSFVRRFVEGLGAGRGDDVLEGFQRA